MRSPWHEPIDTRRIPLAGFLAAFVSLAVNVAAREAGVRLLDVPPDLAILSPLSVSVTTAAAVLIATISLAALANTQARPFSVLRTLTGTVFLLSCAGPLAARAGLLPHVPHIDTTTMGLMIGMHAATALFIVVFLTTLPRGR
jgi:hypothetical protein